jgi:hypothetical protein
LGRIVFIGLFSADGDYFQLLPHVKQREDYAQGADADTVPDNIAENG